MPLPYTVHTLTHTVAMATTDPTQTGMVVPKGNLYKISERWFRDNGRVMVAGKGGGGQRINVSDENKQLVRHPFVG